MNDLHTFAWYASRIRPHLPEDAFKAAPSRLFGGLIISLFIIAGSVIIATMNLACPINLLISLLLGVLFSGLGFLGHEILHGTVVRKRWLQSFLGGIAMLPFCTGAELWRSWHNLTHHVHTQDEELDPDAWSTFEFLMTRPVFKKMYRFPLWFRKCFYALFLTINFTFVSFLRVLPYIRGEAKVHRHKVLLQFVLPWFIWIAIIIVVGPINGIFIFIVPHLIANIIVSTYIATNHNLNPMVDVNDPLANSLTVTVPWILDKIHFNFSYHVEHHVFPGMNPKYYPLVKKQLKKMWPERYNEMAFWRAILLLFRTPRVYYKRSNLIDPATNELYPTLPELAHSTEKIKTGVKT